MSSTEQRAPFTSGLDAACPVCDQCDMRLVYHSDTFDLSKCDRCGLIRKMFPRVISRDDVQQLQDSVYTNLGRTQIRITQRMAADRFALLREFAKVGNLLEIGCATGEFMEIARDAGYSVCGADASVRYSDCARQKGLNVVYGRFEDMHFDETYDIVAMFHVLEHIENPSTFLQQITMLTNRNAILIAAVPNLESKTNSLLGFRHPVFQQEDHLYFYGPQALSKLLTDNGYDVLTIRTREYPHALFASCRDWAQRRWFPQGKRMALTIDDATTRPGSRLVKVKWRFLSAIRKLYLSIPMVMGLLFYPLLRFYGVLVEKKLQGHELLVVAAKRR